MRSATLGFILVSLLGPAGISDLLPVRAVHAAWPPGGIVLSDSTRFRGEQRPDLIEHDDAGGAYVVWANYSYEDPDYYGEIHVQRVTMNGEVAPGWPQVDGLVLARDLDGRDPVAMERDAADGVYVLWEDRGYLATTNYDVYGSRFLSTGSIAPGWPFNGMPIANTTALEDQPRVWTDGEGAAFVSWLRRSDAPVHPRITRLLPDGSVDPRWPAGGLELDAGPGGYSVGDLFEAGDGNCLVSIGGTSSGLTVQFATRIAPDGTKVPGWPSDFVSLLPHGIAAGGGPMIPDGSGGFYVVWEDYRSYPGQPADPNSYRDIYALHWLADGTRDSRWPADGLPVCTAPLAQWLPRLVLAENRDLWIVWSDVRSYALGTGTAQDLYSMRVRPDGTRAPGWPVDGKPVMQTWDADQDGRSVTDGADGIYVLFEYQTQGYSGIQHVMADGSVDPEYGPDGELVPAYSGIADLPQIAWDGYRGVYVAWGERFRPGYGNGEHVFLTHFGPPQPTAAAVSLASSEATPERVRLTWQVTEIARVTVERRTEREGESWQALGTLLADGTGRIDFEDRDVAPGARYGYRLSYDAAGATTHSGETWIAVPLAYQLALSGLTPNPAMGQRVKVAFTLPKRAPGRLELLDITGRRVSAQPLDALEPGPHIARLEVAGRIPPGIYWVRLLHDGRTLTRKGAVVR